MTDKLTIEIDGRACEAMPGEMIIQVADREGIPIPRFCYHKKLSIAANCRMCLVEAEQGGRPFPKPVPACATPVGAGMKVQTRSPRAIDAQKGTMEFLLINHPLDCPICDQGGECELQDVAMGYGGDVSRYSERKRVVKDEDLGALIATDMTRCIHCTRCVRFGAEIAGVRELGATGRGEDMRIGTFVSHTVAHELSGNIIDLCPVGALTSKPFRFKARAWELTQFDSVSPHDAVGSNVHLHVRDNRVMRVHPKDNEAINETWISDRDRFGYEGLTSDDRLLTPMVKENEAWRHIGWQDALVRAAEGLRAAGGDGIGALIAPNATLEEMYLAQKLLRGLGSQAIDTRLRQQDFRDDATGAPLPWLGVPIAELETRTAVLLVGADIRQEQPLIAHRIRKAAVAGATVALVNPMLLDLTFPASQFAAAPGAMLLELAAIAKALSKRGSGPAKDLISQARPSARHAAFAERLREAGGGALVLLGALAAAHPDYAVLKTLAAIVADGAKGRIGFLPPAANSVGAWYAGALPHVLSGAKPSDTPGANAAELLATPRKTYLLWGVEPEYDLGDPAAAVQALAQAGLVIACTSFRTPVLEAVAHLMLPIAAFTETAGTFVNAAATWQSFQGAVPSPGDARPGWKVLRVLGNLVNLPGFEYQSAAQVREELAALCTGVAPDNTPRASAAIEPLTLAAPTLMRIGTVPVYRSDPLVRRAASLQRTPLAEGLAVRLNPAAAADLGLADGDTAEVSQGSGTVRAPLLLDDALAPGCARIPAAVAGSETLGSQIGPVTLRKV